MPLPHCLLVTTEELLLAVKLPRLSLYCRTCPIVNVNATLATILRGDNEALNLDDLKCVENAWYVGVRGCNDIHMQ